MSAANGATLELDSVELARFQATIDRLIGVAVRPHDLMTQAAGIIESQTRRRIGQTKTAPDGSRWTAWSERYAKTRHSGQSLLQSENHLLQSITGDADGETAEIGSNMKYAATQQFGDAERNIPARPYLGLSPADIDEIENLLVGYVEGLVR